jgi:hypothetical protein
VQNIIVDTVFGVVINPRQMDIIPNLNNNGQLVAMLVTRRKRKDGFAKWAAFPAQALLVSGGLLGLPPAKSTGQRASACWFWHLGTFGETLEAT